MGYFLRAAFQNGSAALLFPSSGGGIYVPQSHPSILSGGREGIVYLRLILPLCENDPAGFLSLMVTF